MVDAPGHASTATGDPGASSELAFQATQRAFAACIRQPETRPPPGVNAKRMRLYARLVYNNVESFLAETFRVFRKITSDAAWRALVRDFLQRHRATSPYFHQIPEEFLEYLANPETAATRPTTPPFALELCHYEWVRLALRFAPDATDCVFDDEPAADTDALVLSPLAWSLRYAYPVTAIGPGNQPEAPPSEPTYLVAYRDRHHRVRFMASDAVTARLLRLIDEGRRPAECFQTLAQEIGGDANTIELAGRKALARLRANDIVARPTANAR